MCAHIGYARPTRMYRTRVNGPYYAIFPQLSNCATFLEDAHASYSGLSKVLSWGQQVIHAVLFSCLFDFTMPVATMITDDVAESVIPGPLLLSLGNCLSPSWQLLFISGFCYAAVIRLLLCWASWRQWLQICKKKKKKRWSMHSFILKPKA